MRSIHTMHTRNYAGWGHGGFVSLDAYNQPESVYWQERAATFKGYLERQVSAEVFSAWAELTWPGESIDACTWRQIARANEAAYRAAYAGQTDPATLAGLSIQAMKEITV